MEFIAIFILGVFSIVLGIVSMRGNLSLIKPRHRKRVAPENRLAYGRLVGTGSILLGFGFLVSGVLFLLAELKSNPAFETAGGTGIIISAVIGSAFMLFATIKYNKGLF